MSDIVIKAEGLGKSYIIGHQAGSNRYVALRDVIAQTARNAWHKTKDLVQGRPIVFGDIQEEIWALRDVNFEVQRGEAVGIIGRNGAGKSTLLKVLSRITEPSAGRVTIRGRVASLLEVGTGFHPELTGRENIYLNGAILGMTRAEIKRKFDEIVAFAEVEQFLDTPVKRYSSGMYVRLAFAVAAHLNPEILVVDEVLAVGDAAFQKKCLGKMGDVALSGRTVLFVSHNMGAIIQLCTRAIVLANGQIIINDDVSTAVSRYLTEFTSSDSAAAFGVDPQKDMQITSMAILTTSGSIVSIHPHTLSFVVLLVWKVIEWKPGTYICLDVFNETGLRLLWSSDVKSLEDMLVEREPGVYESRITVPGMVLTPGRYYFTGAIYSPMRRVAYDIKDKTISVEIVDGGSLYANLGIKPHAATMIPLSWETRKIESSN